MTQKGPHTWDMFYTYHRCPSCGYIDLSREDVKKQLNIYQKELICPRCKKVYITEGKPHRNPDTLR